MRYGRTLRRPVSIAGRCLFERLERRLLLSGGMKMHNPVKGQPVSGGGGVVTPAADMAAPVVTLTSPGAGAIVDRGSPAFKGVGGTASGDLPVVTIKIYAGGTVSGSAVQTMTTALGVSGAYSITAAPLAAGIYTAQVTQSDASANVGNAGPVTFMVYTTTAGDADGDGTVSFADFVILSNHFGLNVGGTANGDFNFDNVVNFADFVILSNHFGTTAAVANALLPGTGFVEATPQAPTNGSGAGSTTKAVGRWDVVPYQTFSGTMNVGVVAFNTTGIDHVSFSVNGGTWTNVYSMTSNPQTNVVEYWCALNAASFGADGLAEVRAIAYPKVGVPRVLQGPVTTNGARSLYLYENGHGTLSSPTLYVSKTGSDASGNGTVGNPYQSIVKAVQAASSGTTIYLTAGTYQFGNLPSGFIQNNRWITITPAPGVARSLVIVQPNSKDMRVYHLALSNLTLDALTGYDLYTAGVGSFGGVWTDAETWVDNCSISSSLGKSHLPELGALIDISWAASYLTNSTIHDYPGRAIVANHVEIIRNVQITNIGDDAIDNPQLVVNTTIDLVVANDPADHIDAVQYFPDHSDMNSIVYGVKATRVDGQLLFGTILSPAEGGPVGGSFNNIAVVNYLATSLEGPLANPSASQIGGGSGVPCDNLLFVNITLPNQNFFFINDPGTSVFTNTVFDGNVVWRLYESVVSSGISITGSHIIDFAHEASAIPVGSFTTGDPGFVTGALGDGTYSPTGDFHLKATSVLKGRMAVLRAVVDLDGVLRVAPGSIGAYV